MESNFLKKYEYGNFKTITLESKPTFPLALLRLENFVNYYFRGPGCIDYQSDSLGQNSVADEILYIEQRNSNKIECWIIFYDEEHEKLSFRNCFWNKAGDRNLIMSDESYRDSIRTFGPIKEVLTIKNQTIIDIQGEVKAKLLNAIKDVDDELKCMSISFLFQNRAYDGNLYSVVRSYDIDERIEYIVDTSISRKLYRQIEAICQIINDCLTNKAYEQSDYELNIDYQASIKDVIKNIYGF